MQVDKFSQILSTCFSVGGSPLGPPQEQAQDEL